VPVRVIVSKKSAARNASAGDRGKVAHVCEVLWCGVDAGVSEDLPDGGRGELDSEDEKFAVDAPLATCTVLARQT
jgi:hypothetical protein